MEDFHSYTISTKTEDMKKRVHDNQKQLQQLEEHQSQLESSCQVDTIILRNHYCRLTKTISIL